MPKLENYRQFDGLHWETGTVRNHWDTRGVKAPHTGQPYTEALLMGISGGIVMAYFPFSYEGWDPMAHILTRNTFDPLDALLERLGVIQHLEHTNNADKARRKLVETLEDGVAPLVWADVYSLPYNAMPTGEAMWQMWPVVVFGYDEPAGTAWLADRARVPICVTTAELDAARARIKKDKFRLLTLDAPNADKLSSAVQKGIWDTIKLFLEAPPKGSRDSFGLAAYRRLASLLTKPNQRQSWERDFPAGRKMYSGLAWMFWDSQIFGKDENGNGGAERGMYADFLDEASTILNKPALQEAARQFRVSGKAWCELGDILLPDEVGLFKEARDLMQREHRLLLEQGGEALPEIQAIRTRLGEIRASMESSFPLDAAGVAALRERIADQLMRLHDVEKDAILTLQEAMA